MRFIFTFSLITSCLLSFGQVPQGFVQRQIARGLNPTTLAMSPNGRLFIVEKDGNVYEVTNDVPSGDAFLSLPNVDTGNERGLSGMCFHPNFPNTPFCYVYYTLKDRNQNRLSRFRVNGKRVDPVSETVLMEFDPMAGSIHNSGALRFGTDRKLYVAVGDGGAGDAQSLNTNLGKILRLNDDGSIPADNPFFNQTTGNRRAIYALGFRNPFSMDIDPVSGRIFVGDVGLSSWEEINDVKPGRNYGWPLIEGKRNGQTAPANYEDPLYAYGHNEGCAVTGVAFYNPPTVRFPSQYKGRFFFADYCNGTIKMLDPATGQLLGSFVTDIARPVGMVTSPDGFLYYVARAGLGGGGPEDNTSTWNGTLHKVSYLNAGTPYITTQPTGAFVPVGERVTFTIEATGQKPMTYRWTRNGVIVADGTQNSFTIQSPTLADNGAVYECTVTNAVGTDRTTPITLRVVQGQRPVARIRQPVQNTTYRGGDVLAFSGDALTAGGQPLTSAKLTWWVDFHHEDHDHPALEPVSGVSSGTYRVPRVGETSTDVWYRIHLRATDVSGLTADSYVDVKPQLTTVNINSKIPDAPIYLDGEPRQAPFSIEAVAGMQRTLETKPYRATATNFLKFTGWGNGQTANRITYEIPAQNAELNLSYEAISAPNGNGLWGEYYTQTDNFTGTPALVRVDETINFDWADGSPGPGVSADQFVVRWTGKIQAPFTDAYTFFTDTDDGLRLWIDNKLLIDKWMPQPGTVWWGRADLQAGRQYDIKMEYLENQGGAMARLFWSSPSFDRAIVSKPYLNSVQLVTANEPTVAGSLTVFPSPTRERATLHYVSTTSSNANVHITDLLGRRVYAHSLRLTPGLNEHTLSVTDWPAGLYLVTVEVENGAVVNRRLLVR